MIIHARTSDFEKLFCRFVRQFAIPFNAFLRTSFHLVGPRNRLCVKFFPPWYFVSCSSKNSWFELFSVLLTSDFISQMHVVKKWCWFSKIDQFHQFLPHRTYILLLSTILMSSTCTDKNNPCFRWTKRQSPFGTFFPIQVLRTVFPTRDQQVGARTNVDREEPLDLQCWSIHISGHSDFGILSNLDASSISTWVYADTASAACPSQSGSLAMTLLLLLSFETQTSPVQWTLHELQSRILQRHLGVRLCLEISEILFPTPHFWDDTCPPMQQSGLSSCLFMLPE